MNKRRINIILAIMLIALLCISLAACSFGKSAGNKADDDNNQRYSASDETAMAVGRIKGASYQPDLSSIVGGFAETPVAENASASSDPSFPTTIKGEEVTGVYAADDLIPTKTMWLERVQTEQEDADKWGKEIKEKIYKYIDKAVVFDKWIQTTNLPPYDDNYISFMIHYDYETDTVILYEELVDLCAYMYYFDENGNEVFEVFSYSKFRDASNYSPSEYTKYVKDVSYTFVHIREEHTAYYNLSNNDGELSFVNFEQYTDDRGTHAEMETLINDGAKALFYSTSSEGGTNAYSEFEYIYNGEKLFNALDMYTTDGWVSHELHPITEIEYSLRALTGFKYVANTQNQAFLLDEYIGDRIYSETNPDGEIFSKSSFNHDDGRPVGGVDDVIMLLDVEPELNVTSYIDIDKITGDETYFENINTPGDSCCVGGPAITIDKDYYQRLFAKIAATETPNGYTYYKNVFDKNLDNKDTNPIFKEWSLHQGWKLAGDDMNSIFDDTLTENDDQKYLGGREPNTSYIPMHDVYYLDEANWYTGGGRLRIYDYEGIDLTDSSLPVYLKSEYLPYYYDFRVLYNDFAKTIKKVDILGVTDVLSKTGQSTLLAKIKKLVENEFCRNFDINDFTIVTPDQLENTTATMLTPTVASGVDVTASLTNNDVTLSLSVSNLSINVAKNILLQSGAEYRAEIGYFNANNVITTSLVGAGVAYDGNDLRLGLSGSVDVDANMIFDEDYTVCAFVSKKIDGKFVKVSSGVQLSTSQSAVAPDTFIADNFDKIVGDDFKLGYGAKNVNGKMVIVKRGTDDVVPTIAVEGYTALSDISDFQGEGLSISAVYEIPRSDIANLAELKALMTASDNVNGSINIGLNNIAEYQFVGEEEPTLVAKDTVFTSYSDMLLGNIFVITIADSSGNTTQIAIALKV